MTTVTFQNGNKEVNLSISGGKEWKNGDKERVYFDVDCDGKRTPVRSFYKLVSGGTRDEVIEVGGVKYAFEYGIDANSKSKKAAIKEAMKDLASKI